MINRFLFNFFNYYLPMLIVAFKPEETGKSRNYFDLYLLMVTQMAVKQIAKSSLIYAKPLLLVRRRLAKL